MRAGEISLRSSKRRKQAKAEANLRSVKLLGVELPGVRRLALCLFDRFTNCKTHFARCQPDEIAVADPHRHIGLVRRLLLSLEQPNSAFLLLVVTRSARCKLLFVRCPETRLHVDEPSPLLALGLLRNVKEVDRLHTLQQLLLGLLSRGGSQKHRNERKDLLHAETRPVSFCSSFEAISERAGKLTREASKLGVDILGSESAACSETSKSALTRMRGEVGRRAHLD